MKLKILLISLFLCSVFGWGQTLYDSFSDGNFTLSPVWSGSTTYSIVSNSDVAAGVTGSNTLRLNVASGAGTKYLSSQISTWENSQEWGFWIGRRAQAFTAANEQFFWLFANESDLTSATVDGYRIAIGDDTGGDNIRLEYIVNGVVNTTIITSTSVVTNGLTDIGFLIRVTRSTTGVWEIFTSTLPTTNGNGAIASAIPSSANANTSQGSATHNTLVPTANGYIGIASEHSSGASALVAQEFDQIYFTPTATSSNTITTTTPISGSPFCVTTSSGTSASVDFTSIGTFTGNTFTAQLSNASGSFTTPISSGTLSLNGTNPSGNISVPIPANTPTGTGYLIRVISNGPSVIGSNTAAFTINLANNSIAPSTTQNIFENTNGSTLTVTEQSTPTSRQWYYGTTSGGSYSNIIGGATGTTYTPNFTTAGTYYVVCISTFPCGAITSNQVQVNVTAPPAGCNDLFISEYIEGSSNNKYLEIYNPTASSINLADYSLRSYANGSATISNTLNLSGTIAAYSTFVIENSSESLSVVADLSTNNALMTFNGNDAIALYKISTTSNIDIIGQIGNDPVTEWGTGNQSTADNTIVRNFAVQIGDSNGTDAFTPVTQWTGYTTDNISNLGAHSSSCAPLAPEMNIQGNAVTIVDGDATPIVGDDTDFGTTNIAGGTIVKTFTIQNTGTNILNIGTITIGGVDAADFNITTSPSATVSVGSSTTFQITFDPTIIGIKNATITIVNDDLNENPYNFSIRGTAIATPNIVLNSNNPAVASSNIVQGTTNNIIYAFHLSVTAFDAVLNSISFTTGGTYAASNITNFKAWYSTDAVFNSGTDIFLDNETATLGTGVHTFSGFTQTIPISTTGYLFITTDIPCAATNANTLNVQAITTADLTFSTGNKSGTANSSGTHTIISAIPTEATGFTTTSCENNSTTLNWTNTTGCFENVVIFATSGSFSSAIPSGNGAAYIPSNVFGGGTAFDGGFCVYKGTATSETITNLVNGTNYTYKIFTRNDLNWTNGIVVSCTPTIAYCVSNGNTSFDTSVTFVEFNTISNATPTKTNAYENFTAISTTLSQNTSYDLTVNVNTDGNFTVQAFAWIDWNQDGDFTGIGESYDLGSATNVVDGITTLSPLTITIPATALIGTTRMRVSARYSSDPLSCDTAFDGEVEDYTIVVATSCVAIHTVSSFLPTSGSELTEIYINGTGFTSSTTVSINGTNATVTFVNSTQLVAEVALGTTTGFVQVTENGCQLNASTFTILDTSGTCSSSSFTDLIISEVYDSFSGNGWYMELYNPTSSSIDLDAVGTDYAIERYGDIGDASPTRTIDLTGTIAPNSVYTLRIGSASPNPCNTISYSFTELNSGINENDEIRLTKNGVNHDVVHCPNELGYSILRNATASGPSTTFVPAQWTTDLNESCADLGIFNFLNNVPSITSEPTDVNICDLNAIFSITATPANSGVLSFEWYYNVPNSSTWTLITSNVFLGITISGETTNTVNLSGNLNSINNYQFHCIVTEDGTCEKYSNAFQLRIEETTWNWDGSAFNWTNGTPTLAKKAILNANYNTTTNGSFSCCSLEVASGYTLDIQPNTYVEIENDLLVTGTLDIKNSGSLIQNNDLGAVTNNGTTTVRRTTTPFELYDYTYWSSPVESLNLGLPLAGWRLDYAFTFNTSNYSDLNLDGFDDNSNTWTHAPSNQPMAEGVGYAVMGPTSGAFPKILTIPFSGAVRNGVVSVPLELSENAANLNDDFNLVGNPYPSSISAYDVIDDNPDISGTIYFWTHVDNISPSNPGPYQSNFSPDDYAMYNLSGGIQSASGSPIPNGFIGTGQGFIVEAEVAGNLIFTNSMRSSTYSNSQFFKQGQLLSLSDVEKDRVWLSLRNPDGMFSQTLIGYFPQATMGYDTKYDGVRAVRNNYVSLYSKVDNKKLGIQGRNSFSINDLVPLGFKIGIPGNYSIQIDQKEGVLSSSNIFIEDLYLNTIHDLNTAPYSFYSTNGEFGDRFILRYTYSALSNENFDLTTIIDIVTHNSIAIQASESIKSIGVFDVLGRKLYQSEVNSTTFEIESIQKDNVPLIIQLEMTNGTQITKKIIY